MLSKEAQKILKVVNKNLITDSEINKILSESYAVFRLDKEVTQSGVTPVAYANDTPVIVRDIPGLTQHVRHKENGYIVSDACGSEELVNAMNYTKLNFHHMSRTARKSYEETWAEWNWDKYYDWLKNICNE